MGEDEHLPEKDEVETLKQQLAIMTARHAGVLIELIENVRGKIQGDTGSTVRMDSISRVIMDQIAVRTARQFKLVMETSYPDLIFSKTAISDAVNEELWDIKVKANAKLRHEAREEVKPYEIPNSFVPSSVLSKAVRDMEIGDFSGLSELFKSKNSIDLFHFALLRGDIFAKMLVNAPNETGCFLELRTQSGKLSQTAIGEYRRIYGNVFKYAAMLAEAGMNDDGMTESALNSVEAGTGIKRRQLQRDWAEYKKWVDANMFTRKQF